MTPHRPFRLAVAVAVGLAAGAGMWIALGTVEPHVDLRVRRETRKDSYDLWTVSVTVRGGETLDELSVEPVSEHVHVITLPVRRVRSGVTAVFHVEVRGGRSSKDVVRIVQTGRVTRSDEAPLEEPF